MFETILALRFWRSGLDVYDDRIVVRGIVRDHRLSGDDIIEVKLKPGGFLGWQCPELVTRRGSRIRIEVPTSPKWLSKGGLGDPPAIEALRHVDGIGGGPE